MQLPKTVHNAIGYGMILFFGFILIGGPIIYALSDNEGSKTNLEKVMTNAIESIEAHKQGIAKDTETCALAETELAKLKAADHYSGAAVVDDATLARLHAKAKGEQLTCYGF